MIKKIRGCYLRHKNLRWLNKHKAELNAKYNCKFLIIVDCHVAAVSRDYVCAPYDKFSKDDGYIGYQTPINWEIANADKKVYGDFITWENGSPVVTEGLKVPTE